MRRCSNAASDRRTTSRGTFNDAVTPPPFTTGWAYSRVPRARLPEGPSTRVGLFPKAGDWDARRMVPPDLLLALSLCGATIYVLSRDVDAIAQSGSFGVLNIPDGILRLAAI